jgi:hypothetical protein
MRKPVALSAIVLLGGGLIFIGGARLVQHQKALDGRPETERTFDVFFTSGDESTRTLQVLVRKSIPNAKFLVTAQNAMGEAGEVVIDAESAYPPFDLNWKAWMRVFDRSNAKWAIRCDLDAGVNMTTFELGLRNLPLDTPMYVGTPGYGRPEERDILQMGTGFNEFAMGGCCEAMNRAAGEMFSRAADECRDASTRLLAGRRKPSHDVELGRCLYTHGIRLTRAPWSCTQVYPRGGRRLKTGQMPSAAPCDKRLRSSGVVHPLKSVLAHLAYYSRQPFFSQDCLCAEEPLALAMTTACSKWMVPDECSVRAMKCTLPGRQRIIAVAEHLEAHMITLNESLVPPTFVGFDLHIFDATDNRHGAGNKLLSPGELGLLMSWKRLLARQIRRGVRRFAVFEDDAIQVGTVDSLRDECLSPLTRGGFVVLGWTNWNEWLWGSLLPSDSCVSVTPKTFGAFAVALSFEAAERLLWWIDATAGTLPIDHAWGQLSTLGVPCTAAFPHLFIVDEKHVSAIRPEHTHLARGRTSRWPVVYPTD